MSLIIPILCFAWDVKMRTPVFRILWSWWLTLGKNNVSPTLTFSCSVNVSWCWASDPHCVFSTSNTETPLWSLCHSAVCWQWKSPLFSDVVKSWSPRLWGAPGSQQPFVEGEQRMYPCSLWPDLSPFCDKSTPAPKFSCPPPLWVEPSPRQDHLPDSHELWWYSVQNTVMSHLCQCCRVPLHLSFCVSVI